MADSSRQSAPLTQGLENPFIGNTFGVDCVLVASCLGDSTGGGLVTFDGKELQIIDVLSSTGLTVSNSRFMRLLWCKGDFMSPGELVVYDSTGVRTYYRIDGLSDPHDLLFDGQYYVVASTGRNAILWVSQSGEVVKQSLLPGEPDSWHINSLLVADGELYVTAFGRHNSYRGWHDHEGGKRGIIFHHRTGIDVISGLERPHHARILNNSWIVCNSGTQQVLQFDVGTRELIREVTLEKWTRGLAFSDKYMFVGESARRYPLGRDEKTALGSIAILDRFTWQLVCRIPLPFEEIYDLVLIPRTLLDGIRKGFKVNAQRVLEQNQHFLFEQLGLKATYLWASGELLPLNACAAKMSVDIEPQLEPSVILERSCIVENRGNCIFVSVKPHPVFIAYRWLSKKTGHCIRDRLNPIMTRLSASIAPGSSANCMMRLRTPAFEGAYELEVSLFQWGRGFFSDLGFSEPFKADISIRRELRTQRPLPNSV